MINPIDHVINIDLANKINMNKSIVIKKNDTDSHKFVINIFNNSLTYDLTGTTSRIYFQKADDTKVFLDCTLDNALTGKLSCLLTTQALSYVGLVASEITIYGTAGEILTSVTFNFTVSEVIRDDVAIESTSEFTALTNALNAVDDAVLSIPTVEALNVDLQNNIVTGDALDTTLKADISTGNVLDVALKSDITTGDILDVSLKADISTGNPLDISLKADISTGNPLDVALKDDIAIGNPLDILLKDDIATGNITDTNIKDSTIIGDATDADLKADIIIAGQNEFATEISNARGGEINLDTRLDKVDTSLANMAKININFITKGGKVNDNTYDSTILLQSLTDELFTLGGGNIQFPSGKFYFNGTYIAKTGVTISGALEGQPWSGNAGVGTTTGTTFYHIPTVVDTDFITLDQANLLVGYVGNINIKNIYIIGSTNSKIGLYVKNAVNSTFKNMVIIDFKDNIQIDGVMNIKFSNVTSQRATIHCLYVTGGLSTTATYDKCYFGQTKAYINSIPVEVELYKIIGLNFNNCIFESTEKGLKIDSDNTVSFNNIYVENIPNSSTSPTFDVGMSVPSSTSKGGINFNGGIIQGTVSTIIDGMSIFNVNYSDTINLSGVTLKRSRNVIFSTTNSKGIVFVGCNETSITNNIEVCDTFKKIARINHVCGSTTLLNSTLLPIVNWIVPTLLNGWSAYSGGAKYRKNSLNQIELGLSVTSGTVTVGTIIATLPVGYRPIYDIVLPLFDVSALRTNGYTVAINKNGDIRILNEAIPLLTSTVYTGNIIFIAS
jgi:hypothetical protein